MGPVEKILRDAWKLIEDPKNRAVGFSAFDKDGNVIAANSPEACRWCSYGAVVCVVNKSQLADDVKKHLRSISYDFNKWHLPNDVEQYLRTASYNIFGNIFVPHHNDRDIINNPPKIYAEAIKLAEKDGV